MEAWQAIILLRLQALLCAFTWGKIERYIVFDYLLQLSLTLIYLKQ